MCSPRHPIFCICRRTSCERSPNVERRRADGGDAAPSRSTRHFDALRATHRRLSPSLASPPLRLNGAPKQRTIYTANNQQQLPGLVVATEKNQPAANADVAMREAFNGLGATWDFYFDVFDRKSIDDEGMPLDATVHYGNRYNNAFWNGRQMVFGDGDGRLFNRFTIALDVIGHELTHGVTQDEAQLAYMFQSGALNESMSDVFGSLIKQKRNRQTARTADWLIGEGLFTPAVNGQALRSMKAPGTAYSDPVLGDDPQPDHMSKYINTYDDNGGVHINSGIPTARSTWRPTRFDGYAWEKAGRIWYETLRDSALRPNTGFKGSRS